MPVHSSSHPGTGHKWEISSIFFKKTRRKTNVIFPGMGQWEWPLITLIPYFSYSTKILLCNSLPKWSFLYSTLTGLYFDLHQDLFIFSSFIYFSIPILTLMDNVNISLTVFCYCKSPTPCCFPVLLANLRFLSL